MNLLMISVTDEVHLAGEIALNESLFVGFKTLKLAAPTLP